MEAYQYKIRKEKVEIESSDLPFSKNDARLDNTIIKEISYVDAKKIIVEYEWLKTMPLFNKYFFGIYFNINGKDYLGGVVIYSEEYSANKSTTWDKYDFTGKILLLSRGVCLWWTPKNTASYFISKTLKWIKQNTDYKIITATVDPAAGEIGTIYQSLNWHYIGLMTGNYGKNGKESKRFSVYIDGKLRHSRSIRTELGTIKKSVILSKYPNAIFVPQYRKRRYFHFIGGKGENKHYYNMIKHLILPYPKRDIEDICGIIYLIENKINNKKYVGQTTRGFINRYNEYKSEAKSCNPYILKSIKKHNINNFEFSIIDTAQTLDELNYKEIRHIHEYNSTNRNLGYNIESGGVNSKSSEETIELLRSRRKDVKQTKEWIEKRVKKLMKPVIKLDSNNKIIERYVSLSDAGNNNNNLLYQSILRLCLGKSKQHSNYTWCYYDDYINNTIPIYVKETVKNISEITAEEMDLIYSAYEKNDISIRRLSKEYDINFSTLNNLIKLRENKRSILDNNYILICKITKKRFIDYVNKSGVLTRHIKKTYPDIMIESKFKRKQIEITTGKPWYYEYFDWILN